MALLQVTNIIFENATQKITDSIKIQVSFDCLKQLENIDWKVVYIADACDEEADQELDEINMDSVELGANEFEWEIPSPNYKNLPDPFSIFDASALVLKVSYKKKEFLRINYFVMHQYKSQDMTENPPEEVQWEEVNRVIISEKPRQNMLEIDWSQIINNLIMFKPLMLYVFLQVGTGFGIGVDFGGDLIKGSFLIPGQNFNFIEDDMSKTKIPNAVSFCDNKLFLEQTALSKYFKKGCQSVRFLNSFLLPKEVQKELRELLLNDLFVLEGGNDTFLLFSESSFLKVSKKSIFQQRFPKQPSSVLEPSHQKKSQQNDPSLLEPEQEQINSVDNPEQDDLQKNTKLEENLNNISKRSSSGNEASGNESESFMMRLEELLALQLKKLKKNANRQAKNTFESIVLTIPDNSLSIRSRKMLYSAIKLAEFKPLALVHENTAAAIQQQFKNETPKENIFKLIINIGSLSTKISLLQFTLKEEVLKNNQVLKHPLVKNIRDFTSYRFSGQILDQCFMKGMLTDQEDLAKKRNTLEKMRGIKEVLSVNQKTRVSSLNFKYPKEFLEVKDFLESCSEEFEILKQLLKQFYQQMQRLELSQSIEGIELIGGIVRIPKVKELIIQQFGDKIKTQIDGNMAMSLGASIIAVNQTEGLKTKKVLFQEGPSQEYRLLVKFGETEKDVLLFKQNTSYQTKKSFHLKNVDQNVQIWITHQNEDYAKEFLVKGVKSALEKHQKKNIRESNILIKFEMDSFGLPDLVSASIQIHTEASGAKENPSIIEQLSKSIVSESIQGLFDRKEEFAKSQTVLKEIENYEKQSQLISKYKNEMENHLYNIQEILEDQEKRQFLSQRETEQYGDKILELQNQIENIESLTEQAIKEHLNSLKVFLNPQKVKSQAYHGRTKLKALAHKTIKDLQRKLESIRIKQPWIPEEKINKVKNGITQIGNKIQERLQKQEQMSLHEMPLVTEESLKRVVEDFQRKFRSLELISRNAATKPKESDL